MAVDFIEDIQDRLTHLFIELINEKHPHIAKALLSKYEADAITDRAQRYAKYHRIFCHEIGQDSVPFDAHDNQLLLMEYEAKIYDLCRRVRKIVTSHTMLTYHHTVSGTAEYFPYVFDKFKQHHVTSDEVRQFLKHFPAWFSITAHPTNPCSVEFTKVGDALDTILDQPNISIDELKDSLKLFRDTPIASLVNKTPLEELDEIIPTLTSIYNAYDDVYTDLRNCLDKAGYEDVAIDAPFLRVNLWSLGDGDGNANQTAEALKEGILRLAEVAQQHYSKQVGRLSQHHPWLNDVAPTQSLPPVEWFDTLNTNLNANNDSDQTIAQFKHKLTTFGPYGTTIDLRHHANDLMLTLAHLAKQCDLLSDDYIDHFYKSDLEKICDELASKPNLTKAHQLALRIFEYWDEHFYADGKALHDDLKTLIAEVPQSCESSHQKLRHMLGAIDEHGLAFEDLSAHHAKKSILQWLESDTNLQALSQAFSDWLSQSKPAPAVVSRIIGRLDVAAQYETAFDKFIIAECRCSAHVLAALLLLKISGNTVGTEGAVIDIVTLSESVPDLDHMPSLLKELLSYKPYRDHVKHRGTLIAQIAKSDSVRRHGRGAEDRQETATREFYALEALIKQRYKDELLHIKLSAFEGGGAAVQRGGGKPSEVSHRYGLIALQAGCSTLFGPTTLTIQGHQKQLLLNPSSSAQLFIGSMIAQGIYSAAKTSSIVPPRHSPNYTDETLSIRLRSNANHITRASYARSIHHHGLELLFKQGPWVSVKLGNRSSRSSARGEKQSSGSKTAESICPSHTRKILMQRAIGTDRLCAHSMTQALCVVGMADGLETLGDAIDLAEDSHYNHPLHFMYCSLKAERDSQRNTAIALAMTDFYLAWHMMIGEPRPDSATIVKLAQHFSHHILTQPLQLPNEAAIVPVHMAKSALAWLELEAYRTARLNYIAIFNDPDIESAESLLESDSFSLSHTLDLAWPELGKSIHYRERKSEFAHYVEAVMTHQLNQRPDHELDEKAQMLLLVCYVASDLANTPIGTQSTLTSESKDEHSPRTLETSPEQLRDRLFTTLQNYQP